MERGATMGAEMLSAVCYLLSFARLSCAEGKTRNLLQLIQRRKKGVGGGRGQGWGGVEESESESGSPRRPCR